MKFNSFKNVFLLGAISTVVLSSCIKNEVKELGTAGNTFIKFLEAPENKFFFEPYSGTKPVNLFSLRRDANSTASLNQSVTVTLRVDTAAIRAYNTRTGSSFSLLPDSLITLPSGFTKSGPLTYETTLAPGEFAKEFIVQLNGSKWDLSKTYAMPFTIVSPGGFTKSNSKGSVISLISIKNQYDATYQATGVFRHPTAGDRAISELKNLVTAGPNSVRAPLGDLGGANYYMILTVEADNKVTITPSGATPNIDQSYGPNYYDPATKTFHLWYSYNTAAPRIVEETLERQ